MKPPKSLFIVGLGLAGWMLPGISAGLQSPPVSRTAMNIRPLILPVQEEDLDKQARAKELTDDLLALEAQQDREKAADQADQEDTLPALDDIENGEDRKQDSPLHDGPLLKPISQIRLDIHSTAEKNPDDRSTRLFASAGGDWLQFTPVGQMVHWEAPQIGYRRLYFEDPILERYGQCDCHHPARDVFRSGVHFSMSFIMWPLRAVNDLPGACDTPLGYCRPGTPTPCHREQLISR